MSKTQQVLQGTSEGGLKWVDEHKSNGIPTANAIAMVSLFPSDKAGQIFELLSKDADEIRTDLTKWIELTPFQQLLFLLMNPLKNGEQRWYSALYEHIYCSEGVMQTMNRLMIVTEHSGWQRGATQIHESNMRALQTNFTRDETDEDLPF
jgi:hypothetical protein